MLLISRRPPAILTIVALAVGIFSVPAAAQQISITVNGQPLALSPGPIEQQGRVFVPMRGIFERFGAGVVYSAGTINATKGSTTIQLRIGSTQATINGQPQTLDVAPFIVGATTYVPLRFIAQSLGAQVGYDNATRVVSIAMPGQAGGPPPVRPPPLIRPPPPVRPPPLVGPEVRLRNQQPPPGSETRDRFIVISAQFSRNVDAGSVRVLIDGANRTNQSGVSSTGFSFRPPAPFDFGGHTARVTGRAPGGVTFDRSWSFSVRRQVQIPLTVRQPVSNATVSTSFTVSGSTVANGRIRVAVGAAPSTTGLFSGTTNAGPGGNFSLVVRLTRTMPGMRSLALAVTATDPVSLQTAQTTVRVRLR
ncbi:MAG: copper amine oxidase N-terminal domain-containing protein [Candidatus Cybelea sp.]